MGGQCLQQLKHHGPKNHCVLWSSTKSWSKSLSKEWRHQGSSTSALLLDSSTHQHRLERGRGREYGGPRRGCGITNVPSRLKTLGKLDSSSIRARQERWPEEEPRQHPKLQGRREGLQWRVGNTQILNLNFLVTSSSSRSWSWNYETLKTCPTSQVRVFVNSVNSRRKSKCHLSLVTNIRN